MESRIKYNLKQGGESYKYYYPLDLSNISPKYDILFALSPKMPDEIKRYTDDCCHELKHTGEYEQTVNKYLIRR